MGVRARCNLRWHTKVAAALVTSPGIKTIATVCNVTLCGILSGAFIAEISGPAGLRWGTFYLQKSFYALVVLAILTYLWNRLIYSYEKDILRFADEEYCLAYMRSRCLPAAAERYTVMILNGEGGELERAMEEMRRILK
jgi:hypothetical protein